MPAVDVTITYLEMEHPSMLRARRVMRDDVALQRVDPPTPAVAARFYGEVGGPHAWLDRAAWTDEQWNEELKRDGTELWVLKVNGNDAGFFELVMPGRGTREIQFFGLLPGFAGQGLGAHLLTLAIERAWDAGTDHLIVNTCTLDHPSALPNYLARGFAVVRTRTERRELPERT